MGATMGPQPADQIGRLIKSKREQLKETDPRWTQAHLADEVNAITGGKLQGADISRWEAGRHRPAEDNINAVVLVLGLNVLDFYAIAEESQLDRIERKLDELLDEQLPVTPQRRAAAAARGAARSARQRQTESQAVGGDHPTVDRR